MSRGFVFFVAASFSSFFNESLMVLTTETRVPMAVITFMIELMINELSDRVILGR